MALSSSSTLFVFPNTPAETAWPTCYGRAPAALLAAAALLTAHQPLAPEPAASAQQQAPAAPAHQAACTCGWMGAAQSRQHAHRIMHVCQHGASVWIQLSL